MSTTFDREFRRIKEQVEILTGDRGGSGKPERAVRLKELGERQASSGTGQAITKVSQLENDKGYVTAGGAAAAAPIQEVRPGTNVSIDNTDPKRPIINATGGTSILMVDGGSFGDEYTAAPFAVDGGSF